MVVKAENFLCQLHLLCNRTTRYLSWIALGVALSAWGEDDLDSYPQQFDYEYPRLEIGFKPITTWKASSDFNRCGRFCSTSDVAASQDLSNEVHPYNQGTNLNLGQSGPFSFRFSDRHLKMEVNF